MTADLWPCWSCGNPGVRNIGAQGYCSVHLGDLFTRFDPVVFVNGGIGLQDGPMRPEYGPLDCDLRCCRCEAGWVGVPGDPCWWCRRYAEIMREHQAELLLRAPDVDPDDALLESRMEAWADRMVVGVAAGLITERQARAVWARACKKVTKRAA